MQQNRNNSYKVQNSLHNSKIVPTEWKIVGAEQKYLLQNTKILTNTSYRIQTVQTWSKIIHKKKYYYEIQKYLAQP